MEKHHNIYKIKTHRDVQMYVKGYAAGKAWGRKQIRKALEKTSTKKR